MVDGKDRYWSILTFLLKSDIYYFYSLFLGPSPSVTKLDVSD